MGKVEIPYYVVKRHGRAFWQPTKRMREHGFASIPCGVDGPEAWKKAQAAYERWLRHLRGEMGELPRAPAEAAEVYPRGSVGEAWQRYTRTKEWSGKALSTRNKVWWPAWRLRIKPMWADVDPNTVTLEMLSDWRAELEAKHGRDPAHKTLKVWRSFWKVMRAMDYVAKDDPSLAVRNLAPRPRRDRWTEGEVVRLIKAAIRQKWLSLACIVASIWDTSFQPGDVRTLRARHMVREGIARLWFDRTAEGRGKTGAAAVGTVSARTDHLIRAYLGDVARIPESHLFANRFGRPYRDDALADDFAVIREVVFPGDRRQMRDMRRSGAVEAIAGGGSAENLASKLANSVNESGRLWRTYVPVDGAAVAATDEARKRGRTIMRANKTRRAVGTADR